MKLARDVKGNEKGYFKYISSEKMTKETVGLLFKEAGNLVTKDMQKLKLLSAALIWSLPVRSALRPPRSLSLLSKSVEVKYYPCIYVL